MNNLEKLMSLCKCSIYINNYRDAYETVEKEISRIETDIEESLEERIKKGMLETNNIIDIKCYPFTPISSITLYHYDINMAIDEMIDAINEWKEERGTL